MAQYPHFALHCWTRPELKVQIDVLQDTILVALEDAKPVVLENARHSIRTFCDVW